MAGPWPSMDQRMSAFAYTAIQRKTSIERWPRRWKINLIERENPHWVDLFPVLTP
jgi:predicted GIY-YIG superfamily endonuclease